MLHARGACLLYQGAAEASLGRPDDRAASPRSNSQESHAESFLGNWLCPFRTNRRVYDRQRSECLFKPGVHLNITIRNHATVESQGVPRFWRDEHGGLIADGRTDRDLRNEAPVTSNGEPCPQQGRISSFPLVMQAQERQATLMQCPSNRKTRGWSHPSGGYETVERAQRPLCAVGNTL